LLSSRSPLPFASRNLGKSRCNDVEMVAARKSNDASFPMSSGVVRAKLKMQKMLSISYARIISLRRK
jgi:hypothetical protein